MHDSDGQPVIGLSPDKDPQSGQVKIRPEYAQAVLAAGGRPMVLVHAPLLIECYIQMCDGFVFTGGDDPRMEPFGVATHPKATVVHPDRQAFETALLEALDVERGMPVLGVCLGMQMMALVQGGRLEQYMPDAVPTAADHWDGKIHTVEGAIGTGRVHSHHKQAITDAGSLEVIGVAHDGVIEAVRAPDRPYYVGVQWHPERTDDPALGPVLFEQLVAAARA
jgi:putative glutamine amidotransferase